jgi:hypothetical protein
MLAIRLAINVLPGLDGTGVQAISRRRGELLQALPDAHPEGGVD